MNDPSTDPLNDREHDLEELFQLARPPEIPVDVDRLLADRDVTRRSRGIDPSWRTLMTTRKGLTVVGLIACALTVLAVALIGLEPASAFAQVKQQVIETKSVRYTETSTDGNEDSTAAHGRMVVRELEAVLADLETKLETAEGDEKERLTAKQQTYREMLDQIGRRLSEQGDRPWETKVMILGGYHKRVEAPNVLGDSISISNLQTGESISIDHEKRIVQRFTKQITINEETGEQREFVLRGKPDADLYGMFRDIPDDAIELAQRKTVGGVELIGYQSTEEHGRDTWTRTVWVDPQTKLPRMIHTQVRSTNPRHASSDWYLSDIEFDVPLDESLFSTDPPPGYEVRETSVLGLVSEEDQAQ